MKTAISNGHMEMNSEPMDGHRGNQKSPLK
jgi:hypothetical protein